MSPETAVFTCKTLNIYTRSVSGVINLVIEADRYFHLKDYCHTIELRAHCYCLHLGLTNGSTSANASDRSVVAR